MDHPLSDAGARQCIDFNSRWNKARDATAGVRSPAAQGIAPSCCFVALSHSLCVAPFLWQPVCRAHSAYSFNQRARIALLQGTKLSLDEAAFLMIPRVMSSPLCARSTMRALCVHADAAVHSKCCAPSMAGHPPQDEDDPDSAANTALASCAGGIIRRRHPSAQQHARSEEYLAQLRHHRAPKDSPLPWFDSDQVVRCVITGCASGFPGPGNGRFDQGTGVRKLPQVRYGRVPHRCTGVLRRKIWPFV
eukprot:SAG11_NODE_1999_length_3940_cov_2.297347_3_plen_248_part_00